MPRMCVHRGRTVSIMYACYCHFNNLSFNKSQNSNDVSAGHVVTYCVSSEMLKCMLLK